MSNPLQDAWFDNHLAVLKTNWMGTDNEDDTRKAMQTYVDELRRENHAHRVLSPNDRFALERERDTLLDVIEQLHERQIEHKKNDPVPSIVASMNLDEELSTAPTHTQIDIKELAHLKQRATFWYREAAAAEHRRAKAWMEARTRAEDFEQRWYAADAERNRLTRELEELRTNKENSEMETIVKELSKIALELQEMEPEQRADHAEARAQGMSKMLEERIAKVADFVVTQKYGGTQKDLATMQAELDAAHRGGWMAAAKKLGGAQGRHQETWMQDACPYPEAT